MSEELNDTIRKAKQDTLVIKEAMPYVFPEWQRLQQAKQALADAKLEHARAEAAWWQLGR